MGGICATGALIIHKENLTKYLLDKFLESVHVYLEFNPNQPFYYQSFKEGWLDALEYYAKHNDYMKFDYCTTDFLIYQ